MANNNAANVGVGKPKAGGAIFRAASGAALPTTASAALDSSFANLGYASSDGLTNSISTDTEGIVAWGGDEVLRTQTSREETFKLTLIETNATVLAAVYGEDNVTVAADSIAVLHNGAEAVTASYVFETLIGANRVKRIVVPNGKITEVGDIVYADGDAVSYEVTISAFPDTDGNTAYEYIAELVPEVPAG